MEELSHLHSPTDSPPIQAAAELRAELHVLCSMSWLVINAIFFKYRNGIWDYEALTAQMKGLGYLFQANWAEWKEAQTQLPASTEHGSP